MAGRGLIVGLITAPSADLSPPNTIATFMRVRRRSSCLDKSLSACPCASASFTRGWRSARETPADCAVDIKDPVLPLNPKV